MNRIPVSWLKRDTVQRVKVDRNEAGRPMPPVGAAGADLPVRVVLPAVIGELHRCGTAVLVAPPGSGKTTLLPLAVADAWPGRVIVAEPRRIATRAAARRMAQLVGAQPGERIGYAMRGERLVSPRTRVEVVTTGLLVRRLQRDQELAGVDAVVIDEVHERQLDTDLALAFCLDVRANLRPELRLVATSATPDTDRLAALLGSPGAPAPVVTAAAALHPVDVIFAPPTRPIPLLPDSKVDPRLLDHVAEVVRRAIKEGPGDVLVFLPGEAEIRVVAGRLADLDNVLRLFGRQTAAEQDLVLQPGVLPSHGHRRVVLTTAVAESSLTVPGVAIVVDAGLSREPRVDHSRGLGMLTTTKVSRSSATQRAGRAGRERPGRAYRCWSASDHEHLIPHQEPEIATADLTGFALAAADWGHPAAMASG
jgi:ATP-dependent helicase HrpB